LTLNTHLILFGFALLVPIMAFAALTVHELSAKVEAAGEQQALALASAIASNIDRDLASKIDLLEALALSPSLKERDLAGFYRQAHDTVERLGARVLLTDTAGREIFNTVVPYGTKLHDSRDLEGIRKVVATRKSHVSNLLRGRNSGTTVYNVEIPVLLDNAVAYVLMLGADVGSLTRIVQQQRLPEHWIGAVVGSDDVMLARSEAAEEFVGREVQPAAWNELGGEGAIITVGGSGGEKSLYAFVHARLAEWRIVARVPFSILETPLRRSWYYLLGAGSAALLLALALAFIFGRRLTRSISAATQAAERIKGGLTPEPVTTSLREANHVIDVLHNTSVELNQRTKALQDSEHRTRDQNLHLEFTMRELLHRSKNLLSIVQAMARQTSRGAQSFDDFHDAFTSRLRAISHSHDLLVDRNWHGAALEDLVHMQLQPFLPTGTDPVSISGQHLILKPKAAEHIGLALHELATNSAKYGALSVPNGKVDISWTLLANGAAGPTLSVSWRERGGPPVRAPERAGFGRKVLEGVAPSALNAKATLEFPPEGLVWTLSGRASDLISDAPAVASDAPSARRAGAG
jgi:two-component sensor histidine kinase